MADRGGGSRKAQDTLWADADRIFQEVMELPEAERESRLAGLDADASVPSPVLARVRKLLALEEEALDFLDDDSIPLQGMLESVETRMRADLPEGSAVGRYRVTGVLGRGGTSTVYRAERADGAFDQVLAIKVVRSDLRAEELARRMTAERQILASLSHPNLASVFDGGLTEDGRPWLGVELVEGSRIDRWADQARLSVRERVRLFLQVLGAVQHAHQNLVVHRDLKPSNILVTDDGIVKLLDFGVATLLAPDGMSVAGDETQLADGRWLTPNYAAPEQLLGRPVTTATDIHALGVVLYELITGQRPFPVEGDTRFALERAICESEPRRPSASTTQPTRSDVDTAALARDRRTTPRELQRTLGGDLDAILMKALRKEPAARYASADEFARDLRRYLDGRPVGARGDSAVYRIQKFVRRHVVAATAAALALITLAGSAVALARSRAAVAEERDRARAEAVRAEAEAADANAVIAFLADVFRGRNPNAAPEDTLTALGLVEWAEERVETDFADRPELRMQLWQVLGDAYENLGYRERGFALHDRGLQVALEEFGETSPEAVDALLGASSNRRQDQAFGAALPLARAALATVEDHLPADTSRLTRSLVELGAVSRDLGAPDSAVIHLRRAVALEEAAGLADTDRHRSTLLNLAFVLRAAGEYEEAEARYREGIAALRAAEGDRAPSLAVHLNNLAFLLKQREDYAGADSLYREALALVTDTYGRGHPTTVTLAANLAGVLDSQGHHDELIALLDENLAVLRERWPADHWRVGAGYSSAGSARISAGRVEEALPYLERSLAIYRASLGEDNLWTIFAAVEVEVVRHALDSTVPLDRLDTVYEMARGWHESPGGMRPMGVNLVSPLVQRLEALGMTEWAERFRALLPEERRSES